MTAGKIMVRCGGTLKLADSAIGLRVAFRRATALTEGDSLYEIPQPVSQVQGVVRARRRAHLPSLVQRAALATQEIPNPASTERASRLGEVRLTTPRLDAEASPAGRGQIRKPWQRTTIAYERSGGSRNQTVPVRCGEKAQDWRYGLGIWSVHRERTR
jgi:hypothetical protein